MKYFKRLEEPGGNVHYERFHTQIARPLYDLTFFLRTSCEEQLTRIKNRNGGERLQMFTDKRIPTENQYFSHYDVAHCRFRIDT